MSLRIEAVQGRLLACKARPRYIDDPLAFNQVRIGSSGELVWDDRIDLCPDALYLKVTGKKPEDIFPALRD